MPSGSHQRIGTETGGLGNKRKKGNQSNDSIVGIGQYTKKRPGILRRLAVTQTTEENNNLTLVGKTLKQMREMNKKKKGILEQAEHFLKPNAATDISLKEFPL